LETGGCCGSVVLECANCSLHATLEGALSETVATVSLSTVPILLLLSGQSCHLRVGKRTCGGGQAVSPPTDLAVHSHSRRDQMTMKVRGSFQETAARKIAEHIVKHRDGGVGSVIANHRGGGESSVVVTELFVMLSLPSAKIDDQDNK